jgi:hypothetical protein
VLKLLVVLVLVLACSVGVRYLVLDVWYLE